jgi:hypothetical protein
MLFSLFCFVLVSNSIYFTHNFGEINYNAHAYIFLKKSVEIVSPFPSARYFSIHLFIYLFIFEIEYFLVAQTGLELSIDILGGP